MRVISTLMDACNLASGRINYKYRRNKELGVGTELAYTHGATIKILVQCLYIYVRKKEPGKRISMLSTTRINNTRSCAT